MNKIDGAAVQSYFGPVRPVGNVRAQRGPQGAKGGVVRGAVAVFLATTWRPPHEFIAPRRMIAPYRLHVLA